MCDGLRSVNIMCCCYFCAYNECILILIGLVAVNTGSVTRGVELLPLKHKIFSGWYNKVAIRKLAGLPDEERDDMCKKLLKVNINTLK